MRVELVDKFGVLSVFQTETQKQALWLVDYLLKQNPSCTRLDIQTVRREIVKVIR